MPAQYQSQFDDLRQHFISGLPQKANQIIELWHRLRYFNWTIQGIKSLHSLVHRLRGAGASYGLPEITELAQPLDEYLQQRIDSESPFGGVECNHIDQLISSLIGYLKHETKPIEHFIKMSHSKSVGKDLTVYILDDDLALSSLVVAYLKAHGFHAHDFSTSSELLLKIQQQLPDVILMDVGIHGEGQQGLETMEFLYSQYKELVPVILMSARTDIQSRLRALRAGSSQYVTKPVNFDHLLNSILQVVKKNESSKRVMIVDDEVVMCSLHEKMLSTEGIEVLSVSQPLMALQKAIEFEPDLVVLDMHMPNINGKELALLLRQQEQFIVLPIIFLTADTDPELKDYLESLGVESVIYKPVDPDNFLTLVRRSIRDSTALKNRISKVIKCEDSFQKITNHYFFGAIENTLMNIDDSGSYSAVYYLGLDLTPEMEEKMGIQERAELHEIFCRELTEIIGVDEQWTDINNLTACVLASKRSTIAHNERIAAMHRELSNCKYRLMDAVYSIDVAIGLSLLSRVDSVNGVLQKAENNFFAAKRHVNASPILSDIVGDALVENPDLTKEEISFDFEHGLPIDNLCVSYQPMIRLNSPSVGHFEALIRWKTPSGDLLPASKFIKMIESPNMRIELDRWILQQSINALSIDATIREESNLFINLDVSTLAHKLFFSFATNVLRSARIRGENRIIFNLDETWIIQNPELAVSVMSVLKEIHVGVCLTHAGSSDSTAELITRFKFNYIKLLPDLTSKPENVTANPELLVILAAAKHSGSVVIATQVESSRNLADLWRLGIRLFQGYFVHSPDLVFHKVNNVELDQGLAASLG